MTEITEESLERAATILLDAPVRGEPNETRFVEPGTELVVLVDEKSRRIGEAIGKVAHSRGARVTRVDLPRAEDKPVKVLPHEARVALARAQAAIFAATAEPGERSMREQLVSVVKACNIRHARLPDICETAFVNGLGVDHRTIADAAQVFARFVEQARRLEVTSPAGTALEVSVTPGAWVERLGEIVPGGTVGFPAGAYFTSPEDVSGVFVADASLGEFFGAREGLLTDKPVRLEIERGRVVGVSAPSAPSLEADVRALLGFAENSNRVGLVALGANIGIGRATGDVAVDTYLPGLHLAVGDPGTKSTAVAWKARTSFAACQTRSRVVADGVVLVDNGTIVGAPS